MRSSNTIRIIGGKWKGRKISVCLSPVLRPTPDRLRETLFNWLQPVIEGSNCLDLFAGTGALAFEAMSRGAASATLIEHDPVVFKQLLSQLEVFGAENISIVRSDAFAWLSRNKARFGIIFLDPPFHAGLVEQSCMLLEKYHTLAAEGIVYVESQPGLAIPAPWISRKQSKAGHVQACLIEPAA